MARSGSTLFSGGLVRPLGGAVDAGWVLMSVGRVEGLASRRTWSTPHALRTENSPISAGRGRGSQAFVSRGRARTPTATSGRSLPDGHGPDVGVSVAKKL